MLDDRKEKHESYELNFVIVDNDILDIDKTFYGENKEECIAKFIDWYNDILVKLTGLSSVIEDLR